MGDNKPSSTARVQALRERRAGLKRVEVYANPDDAERIKQYAAKLARKRERTDALIETVRLIAARPPSA